MIEHTETGPLHDKDFRIAELGVIVTALVFALLGATYAGGDTAFSRLATVLSLTQHGKWYIDRPPCEEPNLFEQKTIDKVMVGGRMLSSKPPILPLAMTGEYLVLNRLFGWDLNDSSERARIVRYMTFSLIGLAYVTALIFMSKTLHLFAFDPLTRLLAITAMAFCTQLWGFAHNINNHMPAACMVMVSTYFALGLGTGKLSPAPWRFFLFGVAGGLVPTLDAPATVFVFIAGLYLLCKFPAKTLCWSAIGAAIPVGTHCAIMIAATGSPLPVQMNAQLYLYEASYWRSPRGIDALNEPKLTYLFNMTFGKCGLFSLYPILFAGVAAALRALIKRDMPYRGHVLAGAAGLLVLTVYYAAKTNNYGGEAYGFRWYIAATPILLLMGAPLLATVRARWKCYFIALMLAISFYSAWECSVRPWASNREWTSRYIGKTYGHIEKPKSK